VTLLVDFDGIALEAWQKASDFGLLPIPPRLITIDSKTESTNSLLILSCIFLIVECFSSAMNLKQTIAFKLIKKCTATDAKFESAPY
jgi:hypothetical protein